MNAETTSGSGTDQPTKVIVVAFGATAQQLLDPALREAARRVGASAVQVNAPDPAFAEAFTIQKFEQQATGTVTAWGRTDADTLASALRDALPVDTFAWQVEETVPLIAADPGDGVRVSGMANIAFLRKPSEQPYEEWRHYWQDQHTQIALDTQGTFGYVQNRVLAALDDGDQPVVAVVEELFPEEAATDRHVFYGSGGDKDELRRRMIAMGESCAKFGASTDLDLITTARYTFTL